jgi:hypothetical protein
MSINGALSVQLVNAETKEPFEEHILPNGSRYTEVEPNAEYWIRIVANLQQNEHGECVVKVDKEDLGYSTFVSGKEEHFLGIWNRDKTTETNQALKVVELRVESNKPFCTGSIKVHFYQALASGIELSSCKRVTSRWEGGFLPTLFAQDKKTVKSSPGAKTTTKPVSPPTERTKFVRGKLLESITLRYCTALGLIYAGVLPKPAQWDGRSVAFPNKAARDPEPLRMEPTIRKREYYQGNDLVRTTCSDAFDLTHAEDNIGETKNTFQVSTAETDKPISDTPVSSNGNLQPKRGSKRKRYEDDSDYDDDVDGDTSDN